ncbi:MAG TPA: mannonate dehydratase [Candidatus Limiplasma sp.]|nr:mannonate dehydratase [Candidatus Limiplasma sp.]HRX07596.1 mannonate dehydratase [Candidatus Limiplasma sp.]
MRMTFRWFGEGFDTITLAQLRQIPGVQGVVTTLYDSKPGDEWDAQAIAAMQKQVEAAGLRILGIESVNIHDAIKVGTPERDRYIENYIRTIEKLGRAGVPMICYNFMPVFDWTRSDLAKLRPDGSTVMAYDQREIDKIDPARMFEQMESRANGFVLPGWEPERMARIKDLFTLYQGVTEEKLFENLCYFLRAIMPVCDAHNVNMAIHIDDPVWSVFGLPRIINSKHNIQRLLAAVPNKHNGVTLCTGSLSSNPQIDIPDMIRSLHDRIHFVHMRNTKHTAPGVFEESAHYAADGSLDMVEIMQALVDIGYTGPIRPDHGRAVWGEISMPGYGLFDRAMGSQYLLGLYDALIRKKEQGK